VLDTATSAFERFQAILFIPERVAPALAEPALRVMRGRKRIGRSTGAEALECSLLDRVGNLPSVIAANHQLAAVTTDGPFSELAALSFVPHRPMAAQLAPDPFQRCLSVEHY
jgi:hypothetical protein